MAFGKRDRGRPLGDSSRKKSVYINVRVDREMLDKINYLSYKSKKNTSDVVRMALNDAYLNEIK